MPDQPDYSWDLTVTCSNGVITVTDNNGDSNADIIYRGETDAITFKASTGVRSVDSITYDPPPRGVSLSQVTSGADLVVTDVNSLLSTDPEVDVSYCVNITDTGGSSVSSDPMLVNRSTVRPT